jgi:hypothetical protein
MPDLSAEEYQELQKLLTTPGLKLDDETRTRALQARATFDDQHLAKQMNPSLPLLPQALSTQPGNTHPEGDDGANRDWLENPQGAAAGTVFVYEPPLAVAKKELLENPQIAAAMMPELYGPGGTMLDPQQIAALTTGDSLYQAYADHKWRETADAAAQSGKTAYRYSKSPTLHDGKGIGAIQALGMKLKGGIQPASDSITAFMMGVDDAASFGAVRKAGDVANPEVAPPNELLGIESVGGIPKTGAKERSAMLEEDNPAAHMAGRALGTLAPWSLSNKLFQVATGVVKPLAGAGAGIARKAAVSGLAGSLGGGADAMAREGVQAAGAVAEGQPVDIQAMPERLGTGAVLGGAFGAGADLAGQALGGAANVIRHGDRYEGLPGQLEKKGVEFSPISGPKLSPETQAVIERARAMEANPRAVMADDISADMARGADEEVKSAMEQVHQRKQEYFRSNEGQAKKAPVDFMNTSFDLMTRNLAENAHGKLQPVNKATFGKVRELFNAHVTDVSSKPVEGAIELTTAQADAILSASNKAKLLKNTAPPKKAPEASGGAREVDLGGSGPTLTAEQRKMAEESAARAYEPGVAVPNEGTFKERDVLSVIEKGGGVAGASKLNKGMRENPNDPLFAGKSPEEATRIANSLEYPIDIAVDGDNVMLRDGRHRLEAAQKAGATSILARVRSFRADGKAEEVGVMVVPIGGQDAVRDAATVPPKGKAARPAGRVQGKADRDVTPTKLYPASNQARGEYGEAMRPYREAQRADNARAAGLADELMPEAASKEPLSASLGRRGVKKVYVVPMRYTPEQMEHVIKGVKAWSDDASAKAALTPQAQPPPEIGALDKAARVDRDEFTVNGVKGGWSAIQGANAQLIDDAKRIEAMVAPGHDSMQAYKVLAGHQQMAPGSLLESRALNKVAEKQGVREQLEQIRAFDPTMRLRGMANFGRTGAGLALHTYDAATLRAFPWLRALGDPGGRLRGGMGGVAGPMVNTGEKQENEP